MSHRQQLRQKLFEQGCAALGAARPTAPTGYCCPICLRGFPSTDFLTLEDVPPESVGGKPLVLTCKDCNNTAGHELDSHIAAAAEFADIAAGRRPLDTRFTFAGETITASVRFTKDNVEIVAQPFRSDPKAQQGLLKAFEVAAAQQSTGHSFNISFLYPHDPWREDVAWLRVGYLYAFAGLGYNYILRPQLTEIRSQIKNPDQLLVPYLVKRVTRPTQREVLHFIFTPPSFRSIAVLVRDRLIVLPDFEYPSTLKARLASLPPEAWPNTFSGKSLPIPTRPYYLTDFRPSYVRLLSPDFAEPLGSEPSSRQEQ